MSIAIPRLAAFTSGVHPLLAAYAASFTDIAPPELSSEHPVITVAATSAATALLMRKCFFMMVEFGLMIHCKVI